MVSDVEGRKNRNYYGAERIQEQSWQKIQEIKFGRERTRSGIAENTEDRHFKKDRQSQNPKRKPKTLNAEHKPYTRERREREQERERESE